MKSELVYGRVEWDFCVESFYRVPRLQKRGAWIVILSAEKSHLLPSPGYLLQTIYVL